MSTPTPHRVKHDPQPRQAGVPPTMRVSIELGYVQSCPDCRAVVEQVTRSCIGDPTVTGFRATPGRKHAHDTADGSQSLPGLTSAATGQPEPAAPVPEAVSDTNGSAPQQVEALLFRNAPSGTNGFDAVV